MTEGDKRIVPAFRVARSLETARAGDVMLIHRSMFRQAISLALIWLGVFSIVVVHELVSSLIGVWAGHVIFAAFVTSAVVYYGRLVPLTLTLRKVLPLLSLRRYRDAGKVLARKLPQRWCQPMLLRLGAVVAWKQGDHAEALRLLERGAARARGEERALNAGARVLVLATSDRVQEARELHGSSGRKLGGAMGEWLERHMLLALAFHADDRAILPDDEVLHRWTKETLARNHFRDELVLLSWAAWRSGDEDMARHILTEALPTLHLGDRDASMPKVSAWIEERAKEWGLEAS